LRALIAAIGGGRVITAKPAPSDSGTFFESTATIMRGSFAVPGGRVHRFAADTFDSPFAMLLKNLLFAEVFAIGRE